jgi:hypothetical protein
MDQSSTIGFALVTGFIVYITVRGELPAYLCVVGLGQNCPSVPTTLQPTTQQTAPPTTQQTAPPQNSGSAVAPPSNSGSTITAPWWNPTQSPDLNLPPGIDWQTSPVAPPVNTSVDTTFTPCVGIMCDIGLPPAWALGGGNGGTDSLNSGYQINTAVTQDQGYDPNNPTDMGNWNP